MFSFPLHPRRSTIACAAGSVLLAAVAIWQVKVSTPGSLPSASSGAASNTNARLMSASRAANRSQAGAANHSAKFASQAGARRFEHFTTEAATVARLGSDLERMRSFVQLLGEMTPADAVAVQQVLLQMQKQGVSYENLWEMFWMRWGELDGAGAMEFIVTTQTHPWVSRDVQRVMRGWAALQPEAAAQWLNAHQDDHFSDALTGLTEGYATKNLAAATTMALQTTRDGDPVREQLMEVLAEQALRQGFVPGLIGWFERLPAGEGESSARVTAFSQVASRLVASNTDEAIAWLVPQSSAAWRDDSTVSWLAERMATDNPAAAAGWVQSIPASKDGQYPGLENVMQHWVGQDAKAAAQWLQQLRGGAFKDQATAFYSQLAQDAAP